jgi:hypothetical protein
MPNYRGKSDQLREPGKPAATPGKNLATSEQHRSSSGLPAPNTVFNLACAVRTVHNVLFKVGDEMIG